MPEWAFFVWETFAILNRSRDYANNAPLALKPSEISAYCNLAGITLSRTEFSLINDLDNVFLSI